MEKNETIDGIAITNIEYDDENNTIILYSGKTQIAECINVRVNDISIAKLKKKKIRRAKREAVTLKIGSFLTVSAVIAGLIGGMFFIKDLQVKAEVEKQEKLASVEDLALNYIKTTDGRSIVMSFLAEALADLEKTSVTDKEANNGNYSSLGRMEETMHNYIAEAEDNRVKALDAAAVGDKEKTEQYTIAYASKLMAAVRFASENGMMIGDGEYRGYEKAIFIDGVVYLIIDLASLEDGILPKGAILVDNVLYAPADIYEQIKTLS